MVPVLAWLPAEPWAGPGAELPSAQSSASLPEPGFLLVETGDFLLRSKVTHVNMEFLPRLSRHLGLQGSQERGVRRNEVGV